MSTVVIVGSTPSVVVVPDPNPNTAIPVPAQPLQVTGPSSNTGGNIPVWTADDSSTLADGFAVGTGPGCLVQIGSDGLVPPIDLSRCINAPGWSTGDAKLTLKAVADTGWIMFTDGTIGSATSGATVADAATQALFALLFANCADADAPLFTQGGGSGTTRGAQGTAAAAWAANCQMSTPKMLGRALAGAGQGASLTARALGSITGAETHVLSVSEMPSHLHTGLDHGLVGADTSGGVRAVANGAGKCRGSPA